MAVFITTKRLFHMKTWATKLVLKIFVGGRHAHFAKVLPPLSCALNPTDLGNGPAFVPGQEFRTKL